MLNIQRYNTILELIKNKKNIKLNELIEELKVSEATVRRDLNFLEEKGKIKRVHGGAVLVENKEEDIVYKKMVYSDEKDIEATVRRDLNFLEEKGKIKRVHGGAVLVENKEEDIVYKKMVYSDEKDIIGKKAAALVKNGDIVRRDLNFLEEKGKIKRVHGGAVLVENKEEDIVYKKMVYSDEKDIIGKKAAALVKNGDIIYLDAGSTTESVIKYLKEKEDIKVVTNGFTHIEELTKAGGKRILFIKRWYTLKKKIL